MTKREFVIHNYVQKKAIADLLGDIADKMEKGRSTKKDWVLYGSIREIQLMLNAELVKPQSHLNMVLIEECLLAMDSLLGDYLKLADIQVRALVIPTNIPDYVRINML